MGLGVLQFSSSTSCTRRMQIYIFHTSTNLACERCWFYELRHSMSSCTMCAISTLCWMTRGSTPIRPHTGTGRLFETAITTGGRTSLCSSVVRLCTLSFADHGPLARPPRPEPARARGHDRVVDGAVARLVGRPARPLARAPAGESAVRGQPRQAVRARPRSDECMRLPDPPPAAGTTRS
jgi:hypothetical protein